MTLEPIRFDKVPTPELHAVIDPDNGKPPLLLLHGFLSSANHWLPNLAGLSPHFRLIRAELPGHGQSPAAPSPESYHPHAIAAGIEALRLRLGIARWFVCGQSMGGAMALRYALDYPAAVAAVAFTNANGALREGLSAAQHTANQQLIAAIDSQGARALRNLRYHPGNARRWAPEIRERLGQDADHTDLSAVRHLFEVAVPALSVLHELKELQMPVMLINGLYEKNFQPLRDAFAASLPDAALIDLEGNHSINIEQPDAFNQALIAFFQGPL